MRRRSFGLSSQLRDFALFKANFHAWARSATLDASKSLRSTSDAISIGLYISRRYVTSNPASGFEMIISRSLRTLTVKSDKLLIEGNFGIPPQRPNLVHFGTYRCSFYDM